MKHTITFIAFLSLCLVGLIPFIVSQNFRSVPQPLRKAVVPRPLKPIPLQTTLDVKKPPAAENGAGDESAPLYRPPQDLSTLHYNFSRDVMDDEFLDHLQHLTRRIHKNWKSKGWMRFDKLDTSNCTAETPECQMFRDILSPKESEETHRRPFVKCCVEHQRLKEVAMWTLKRLEEANITYFLSTGTALGAIRHGGVVIPWDTDIDIAIFPSDKDRVEALLKNNGERYFHVDGLGKPMFWIHHSRNGKPRDGPHVEIFYDPVYTKYRDKLLPLERCSLYGTSVSCPNKRMFEVWFPSGWQKYGGGHYHGDHRCTVYKNGKRIELDKC